MTWMTTIIPDGDSLTSITSHRIQVVQGHFTHIWLLKIPPACLHCLKRLLIILVTAYSFVEKSLYLILENILGCTCTDDNEESKDEQCGNRTWVMQQCRRKSKGEWCRNRSRMGISNLLLVPLTLPSCSLLPLPSGLWGCNDGEGHYLAILCIYVCIILIVRGRGCCMVIDTWQDTQVILCSILCAV